MAEPPVRDRFQGQTVIVTGSTRGIGETVARRFAAEGGSVVVSGRSEDDGEAVAASIAEDGGTAEYVRADMSDPDSIQELVERSTDAFGAVDVLVNNAAVWTHTAVDGADIDD